MGNARIKIDAASLVPGMFVAQLDRPWLETPFLFQGFEVREIAEVNQLRRQWRLLRSAASKRF